MLIKPDTRTLAALARLSTDDDFTVFKSWLTESKLGLHAESSQIRDEVLLRWNQGAAQAIEDILFRIESAQAALRKSR